MKRKVFFLFIILGLIVAALLTKVIITYKVASVSMMPAYQVGDRIWASSLKKPTYNNIICYKAVSLKADRQAGNIYMHRLVGLEGDTIEINDGYLLRNGTIADYPEALMFNYYVKKKAIYDFKILDHLSVPPVIRKDSVFLTLTSYEYTKLSWNELLHKISKPKKRREPSVAGSTDKNCWNASNYGPLVVPKGYCFVLGDNRGDSTDSRYRGLVPLKNIVATVIFGK